MKKITLGSLAVLVLLFAAVSAYAGTPCAPCEPAAPVACEPAAPAACEPCAPVVIEPVCEPCAPVACVTEYCGSGCGCKANCCDCRWCKPRHHRRAICWAPAPSCCEMDGCGTPRRGGWGWGWRANRCCR